MATLDTTDEGEVVSMGGFKSLNFKSRRSFRMARISHNLTVEISIVVDKTALQELILCIAAANNPSSVFSFLFSKIDY
jgi:hypothetical protein